MGNSDIQTLANEAEAVWSKSYSHIPMLINKYNLKSGVEVGVAFAGHAVQILNATKLNSLTGIDPYVHINNYDDPMNFEQEKFDNVHSFVKKRMKKFGSRYKHIRKRSQNAASNFNKHVDFVYIDADHSYEGVKNDIAVWFDKVNDGGIISGHDYGHVNFPGVKKAVDGYFLRFGWKINHFDDGVWWVKKLKVNISFIIPAYNCEKTVSETIDSIFNNNLDSGDEIICVNDASTDDTAKVLKRCKHRHHLVQLYSNKYNLGGGATRNIAVQHSKNDLIFCLDSDNVLEPGSIAKLKRFYFSDNMDIASFQRVTFFNNSIKNISHEWIFSHKEYGLKQVTNSTKTPISSGNYLYSKQSWISAQYYPEGVRALDAWGFGFKQVSSGSTIKILPESRYMHRIGTESYWIRESKKNQTSLLALTVLIPYLDLFTEETVEYIFSQDYRTSWFDNIDNRGLNIKDIDGSNIINKFKKFAAATTIALYQFVKKIQ